jgi:hypothetical protein
MRSEAAHQPRDRPPHFGYVLSTLTRLALASIIGSAWLATPISRSVIMMGFSIPLSSLVAVDISSRRLNCIAWKSRPDAHRQQSDAS